MNTRTQILVSAAVVGLALATVAAYSALGSDDTVSAAAGGHDHAAAAATSDGGGPIRLGAEAARRSGVAFATAAVKPFRRTVQTVGTVAYDETRITVVNPKVEGWIERLHADFTGVAVGRGQPLMEVYSPMLISAQEELILARRLADEQEAAGGGERALGSARELLESARRRLRYLDVTADEVARIERSGAPRRTVTIRAPAGGVVLEKTAVEGGRVMPGMDLFRIADLSTVWVDGEVFEKDLGLVRTGQHARLTFEAYPGEEFDALVSYVYPTVSLEARTGRVRLALRNPGMRIKPGMYARIELHSTAEHPALMIPRSAVHSTGARSLVFVRRADGSLLHREVTVGLVSGDEIEVLSGLAAGEVVVSSANFLIDAESNMGTSMEAMPGREQTAVPGARAPAPGSTDPHAGHR